MNKNNKITDHSNKLLNKASQKPPLPKPKTKGNF